jgi:tRNA U34 5-carboxymethylaminomethyl modifying GTPase MnmE/TrmE
VEKEGMRRAKARAQDSDVVIVVTEIQNDEFGRSHLILDPEVVEAATRCAEQGIRVLGVINKVDLITGAHSTARIHLVEDLRGHLGFLAKDSIFLVSCKDHNHGGLDALKTNLTATFAMITSTIDQDGSQNAIGVSERHRSLLNASLQHLENFLVETNPMLQAAAVAVDSDVVLAAEALREGASCLARITGKGETGDIEEVLGVIFAKFCVGK